MPVLTGIPNDKYLLMHFDNGVTDANIPNIVTNSGAATVSSVTSKFGGKSLLLNGYGAVELQNVPVFDFGSGNFSISMWVYLLTSSSASALLKTSSKTNNYSGSLIGYNMAYNYFSSQGTSWDIMNAVSFGAIPLSTWTHIEVNRNGDKITTYINGILKSTTTISLSASIYYNSAEPVVIGKHSTNSFVGYIDELLVVKGQSLHNGIDNFTPPVDQYIIVPPELGEYDGLDFGENEVGYRSSIKQGFEFGDLSAEGQLTRQIRRAIRVEQLEGVGTLSRPVRSARRIEQLLGIGDRTQGTKKLSDEFLGELFDLGPRSAERSGTDLESLDTGSREISYKDGNDAFLLEPADRETPTRNGFDIESFDFDSNAIHKFNLTVTPTHQYKNRMVEIKADLLEPSPTFGQFSLSINGDDVVPFSSIDDRINTILVNVSPDKFITGNNLCRLKILRQNGDKEYLDFEVFKEEPKRTQVERVFRSYEGGYDGERMNSAVTLSAYPSFLTPRDKSTTVIKTTEFTRVPLAKYLAVQGVNVDAQGAKILVSFDEGITWKTWGASGWETVNLENIADKGMTPSVINSKTLIEWSEIFKPKSLDFAVYLDDSMSDYADPKQQIPMNTVTSGISVTWSKPGYLATNIYGTMNTSAGTPSKVVLTYADGTTSNVTRGASYSVSFDGFINKCPKSIDATYASLNGNCAPQLAFLRSINLQITPNLKTGYAFII